jgi:hypothetical protein
LLVRRIANISQEGREENQVLRIRSPRDFWAGVMFIVFGTATVLLARNYAFGTAAKMGPGYFPTVLGGLLVALGLSLSLRSLVLQGPPIGKFGWKPLVFVLGSVIAFGLALQSLGLVAAIFILVFISALGGPALNGREIAILAACLAIGSVIVFNYGLKLQFPMWPTWI